MAVNKHFHSSNLTAIATEQNLYANLVAEAIQIYGHDVFYLDRQLVAEDNVLGEDALSKFNTQVSIEMYMENGEGGYAGERELMTQFGLQNLSEATFVVSKSRYQELTKQITIETETDTTGGSLLLESGTITSDKFEDASSYIVSEMAVTDADRPLEGDLIYHPTLKKLFEINFVDHDEPFHQLDNNPVYKMKCRLFEYSSEDLATGIEAVDAIEDALINLSSEYQFTLEQEFSLNQFLRIDSAQDNTGLMLADGEFGYSTLQIPDFGVANNGADALNWANSSMDVLNGTITGQSLPYQRTGAEGQLEIWVYVTALPSSGSYMAILDSGGSSIAYGDAGAANHYRFGIDYQGNLAWHSYSSGSATPTTTTLGSKFTVGSWHHFLVSQDVDVESNKRIRIYVDGNKEFDASSGNSYEHIIGSTNYNLGSSSAGTVATGGSTNITYASLNGFLSAFVAHVGDFETLLEGTLGDLPSRLDPTYVSRFMDETGGITIDADTLTFDDDGQDQDLTSPQELPFPQNETLGAAYNLLYNTADDATDYIIGEDEDVGGQSLLAEDGGYIISEDYIIGGGSVTGDRAVAQNDIFDNLDDDILDFSEKNPFGDSGSAD